MSINFANAPGAQTIRRRLQTFLAGHAEIYLKTLRWTGRGSLEKKIYLSLIRPGDVVFDVGANEGHFTLLFSDLVAAEGEVHAFEPVPPTFYRLQRFVAHNQKFDNIFLNNHACGDAPEAVTIQMPGDDSGQASLKAHQHGSWLKATSVTQFRTSAIVLDHYARGKTRARVDFVKCDVEGAELPVLKGMSDRLLDCQPLVFLEVYLRWTESFGYRPADLMRFFTPLGYDEFFLVTDRVIRLDPAEAAWSRVGEGQSANLLCAVAGRHSGRLQNLCSD